MGHNHTTLSGLSDAALATFIAWILWGSSVEAYLRPAEMSFLYIGAVILLVVRMFIALQEAVASRNRKLKSEIDLRNARP